MTGDEQRLTGEQHYREAEALAYRAQHGTYADEPTRHRLAALAQAHATLALAAELYKPGGSR